MKKIQLFFLITIGLFSCSTVDTLFEVDGFTEFRIELGMNTLEAHYFPTPNVSLPYRIQLSNSGLEDEDLSKFIASRAFLVPKFGDNQNLDFIHAVNVFILDPTDLTKRKEIFYNDFIDAGTKNEIRLLNTLNDVTDFIVGDRAIIETRIELRQFPPSSFDMRLDMTFTALASE